MVRSICSNSKRLRRMCLGLLWLRLRLESVCELEEVRFNVIDTVRTSFRLWLSVTLGSGVRVQVKVCIIARIQLMFLN